MLRQSNLTCRIWREVRVSRSFSVIRYIRARRPFPLEEYFENCIWIFQVSRKFSFALTSRAWSAAENETERRFLREQKYPFCQDPDDCSRIFFRMFRWARFFVACRAVRMSKPRWWSARTLSPFLPLVVVQWFCQTLLVVSRSYSDCAKDSHLAPFTCTRCLICDSHALCTLRERKWLI